MTISSEFNKNKDNERALLAKLMASEVYLRNLSPKALHLYEQMVLTATHDTRARESRYTVPSGTSPRLLAQVSRVIDAGTDDGDRVIFQSEMPREKDVVKKMTREDARKFASQAGWEQDEDIRKIISGLDRGRKPKPR